MNDCWRQTTTTFASAPFLSFLSLSSSTSLFHEFQPVMSLSSVITLALVLKKVDWMPKFPFHTLQSSHFAVPRSLVRAPLPRKLFDPSEIQRQQQRHPQLQWAQPSKTMTSRTKKSCTMYSTRNKLLQSRISVPPLCHRWVQSRVYSSALVLNALVRNKLLTVANKVIGENAKIIRGWYSNFNPFSI